MAKPPESGHLVNDNDLETDAAGWTIALAVLVHSGLLWLLPGYRMGQC